MSFLILSLCIRCIKTNAAKEPGSVDRVSVLRQLVCGGVIAALEVSKTFPSSLVCAFDNKEHYWHRIPIVFLFVINFSYSR
jgi:hypothetical protein